MKERSFKKNRKFQTEDSLCPKSSCQSCTFTQTADVRKFCWTWFIQGRFLSTLSTNRQINLPVWTMINTPSHQFSRSCEWWKAMTFDLTGSRISETWLWHRWGQRPLTGSPHNSWAVCFRAISSFFSEAYWEMFPYEVWQQSKRLRCGGRSYKPKRSPRCSTSASSCQM